MFYPARRCQTGKAIRVDTTPSVLPPFPSERYSEMDVGSRPRTGASSCPGTGSDHSPATDRCTLPRTQTNALSTPAGLEWTATPAGVVLSVRRRQRKRSRTGGCTGQLALSGGRESQSIGITRLPLANSRKLLPASNMHRRSRTRCRRLPRNAHITQPKKCKTLA
jgi:hypothetical protein